jgi:hypothetical protein
MKVFFGTDRFASKADLTAPKSSFRFAPESGRRQMAPACPFCARNGLDHAFVVPAIS